MNTVKAKGWNGLVVGLLAGVVFALGRILAVENEQIGGEGFVSRSVFEQTLGMRAPDGSSYIRSVTVRHRGNIDLVTFEMRYEWPGMYKARRFVAPRPYSPPGEETPFASVEAYLLAMKHTMPDLDVYHAWWDEPWPMFLMWTAGGALVGGLWYLARSLAAPRSPNLTQAQGVGAMVQNGPAVRARAEITDADRSRLEALEAEMIAGISATGVTEGDEHSKTAGPAVPVRTFNEESVPAQRPDPAKTKEYGGKYYPVERKAPHGFTLIELMVTIGIIVLLLAILLPTVSLVRERALQSKCASNIRQIGAGLEIYNQIYHALPRVATSAGVNSAMNDVKVVNVMRCPDDEAGTLSYAMNPAYAGLPKAQGNPSEPMAFETGVGHHGLYNTVFFDGHVDAQPRGSQ